MEPQTTALLYDTSEDWCDHRGRDVLHIAPAPRDNRVTDGWRVATTRHRLAAEA